MLEVRLRYFAIRQKREDWIAKKDFIANVSHELRTPIAMLQGYSEAIVDDIADQKRKRKRLPKLSMTNHFEWAFVNDLLDLARMEAGHITLNLESTDTEELTEKIYRKFLGIAKKNKST